MFFTKRTKSVKGQGFIVPLKQNRCKIERKKYWKYPLKVKTNKNERTEANENQSYDMDDNYS